jgi:hypothetical protein
MDYGVLRTPNSIALKSETETFAFYLLVLFLKTEEHQYIDISKGGEMNIK